MKKTILCIMIVSLSGCTMIDAYLMAKFDPNEYQLVNDIRSLSEIGIKYCQDQSVVTSTVDQIYLKSIEFKNYVEFIPHNEKTIALSNSLAEMAEPLYKRYHNPDPISVAYCKQKLSIIEKSSITIEQVLGDKPR